MSEKLFRCPVMLRAEILVRQFEYGPVPNFSVLRCKNCTSGSCFSSFLVPIQINVTLHMSFSVEHAIVMCLIMQKDKCQSHCTLNVYNCGA